MKTPRRLLNVVPLLLILALAIPIAPTFASTDFNAEWDGSGEISFSFLSDDDAASYLSSGGFRIKGSFTAEDLNDNPYDYGVDTSWAGVKAGVENGFIEISFERTDSHESMYGPADQSTYSYIGASGEASLAFRTSSNFAQMRSSNYKWQNNNQFQATGDYTAAHAVTNGDNHAYWQAMGVGTLDVDHMSDDTGNTGIAFGKGCGCYTNADVTQTGEGVWQIGADFQNNFESGDWSAGGNVEWSYSISFTDGFSWDNFSFNGN